MHVVKHFLVRRSSQVLAVLLALGTGLWVASGVVTGKAPTSKDIEPDATPAEQVRNLVRVRPITVESHEGELVLYGRTEVVTDAELAAETNGQIIRRHVAKGTWVEKGVALFQLAMDDRNARLKEAEALVNFQTIAFNAATRLSQKQFQSKVKLAEAEANLAKAKAALASIRLDIRRTTVRAPIDGYVETQVVDVGDYVRSGDVVATLVSLNPMRIVAQVTERNVTRLQKGGAAIAVLPNGRTLAGDVRYISKVGRSETRTFRVEVWIDNADGTVLEGLTAELKIPTGSEPAHLVSPALLTLDDKGVMGIKAVSDAGRVVFHPVRILADTPEGIWLGGLPKKLNLITVGQEFVRAGQTVRTKDETAATSMQDDVKG